MPTRPPRPSQDDLFAVEFGNAPFSEDQFQEAEDVSLAHQFAQVPPDWRPITDAFRDSVPGQNVAIQLHAAKARGEQVFPDDIFAALRLTRRHDVRVVILGQDPYHGPGQAHGLAFSVQPGVPIPPSLRNIRAELQRDLGLSLPKHGSLEAWAAQGVLLLNTVLTVSMGQAASHASWGWEVLTDQLIVAIASAEQPCVFMLWGAHAQRKQDLIAAAAKRRQQQKPHLILQSNHPSPLSATRGPAPFIGCGHFGQAQSFWRELGQELDWSLH